MYSHSKLRAPGGNPETKTSKTIINTQESHVVENLVRPVADNNNNCGGVLDRKRLERITHILRSDDTAPAQLGHREAGDRRVATSPPNSAPSPTAEESFAGSAACQTAGPSSNMELYIYIYIYTYNIIYVYDS